MFITPTPPIPPPPLRRHDTYELCRQLVHVCALLVETGETGETGDQFRGTMNDPKFVEFHFKKYLPNTARFVRSDEDIHGAVKMWLGDLTESAEQQYGHISDWDVSNITNMSNMFEDAVAFNQDIGAWDVSNVTNMMAMFWRATAFNREIGAWDVSNVTTMSIIFMDTTAFNQDIGAWDVSKVTDMCGMFRGATTFNRDIGAWDVSNIPQQSVHGYQYIP
jgi:surface protein